jgi:putative ABC transport system permease protein
MEAIFQDLRHALRVLRTSPGFTAVAVIMLALAIGATTAIFSVVYGVLLQPLPYRDSHRIMALFEVSFLGTWSRLADPNFDDFRDQSRSFQMIAKYDEDIASLSGGSQLAPMRPTLH